MSFDRIVFDDAAAAAYERIPLSLVDAVDLRLQQLVESPASLSRPTVSPPFPPGMLMHHFNLRDFEDQRWDFTVLFLRLADEMSIRILALVVQGP